jgi:hypothetical protein
MAALTFIVPAHNAASTLTDTLRSIQAQRSGDWSAVVVDDGSTDGTADVAAAFTSDGRITLVRQEKRGPAAARNRGLLEAGGEVLCFLDSDDVVEPCFADVMLPALLGRPGYDIAACWYRIVGPNLEDLDWIVRLGDHDATLARLIEFNPFSIGGMLLRRSGLDRALIDTQYGPGLFDAWPCGQDWDAWLRLTAAGATWAPIVAQPLFAYRQRAGSITGELEPMWRHGMELIERAPVPLHLKRPAQHRWTIRHIARAAARGDAALAAACRAHVAPLNDDELEFLAGCLRWALCQHDRIGPGQVDRQRVAAWRERIAGALGEHAAEVLPHLWFPQAGWAQTVEELRAMARPGDVLVIYGMGRNGRDLVAALEQQGWGGRGGWDGPIAWIDDDPAAMGWGGGPPVAGGRPLPRVQLQDLTAGHIVVVTPDSKGAILATLREHGVERVLARRPMP